jgi:hypothetical protein
MATRGTSVALPELFSDGDITRLWLRKFELCSTANGWKEDDMLKRLPTLLAGKAFAVYERLPEEKKDGYKKLVEALSTAFGGDDMGKHIAMMSFRGRMRKPDEDIQVFAYNLEVLLRRAMPKIGEEDRGTLLKQQFVEGLQGNLKRELLQRPTLSYEETVAIAQKLDLAGKHSSADHAVNQASICQGLPTATPHSPAVAQLMVNVENLTQKVSELTNIVAIVHAVQTPNPPRGRRGPCY